jgi:large subunit ribosomal protein L23
MNAVLIKPIISEKQTKVTEKFPNRFGFVVARGANKLVIKEAIEKMYGVTVERVNTQNYIGKLKTRNTAKGIVHGIQGRSKKAVVFLKDGDTIDLFNHI